MDQNELVRRVTKMYEDMYEGNGPSNPPVTTRLDRIENVLISFKRMEWAFIGAAVVGICNLIFSHIKF